MENHNQSQPTTLDDLAAMINGGFAHVQKQIDDVKGTMTEMAEELTAIHEDVRYLRRSVDMLVCNDAAQDTAIQTLTARVTRLEKKVGLANYPPKKTLNYTPNEARLRQDAIPHAGGAEAPLDRNQGQAR
jgi:hypothetical protein